MNISGNILYSKPRDYLSTLVNKERMRQNLNENFVIDDDRLWQRQQILSDS
jgi:hypothetical protein